MVVRRRCQCPEKWCQLGFSDQAEEDQLARVGPCRTVGRIQNAGQRTGLGAPILPPSSLGLWPLEEETGPMVSNPSFAHPWAVPPGLGSV